MKKHLINKRHSLLETNVSSGIGVRGFGDVTGTPATDDDVVNAHIERVVQNAAENNKQINIFISNNTHNNTNVLDEPDEDNYWTKDNRKGSNGLLKIFEAQENDPEHVAYSRQEYEKSKNGIYLLGKQLDSDPKNSEQIQSQIDVQQQIANIHRRVFREHDMQEAKKRNVISLITGVRMDEDVQVNNTGEGNIAGLGVGPQGEPGISKTAHKKEKSKSIFHNVQRRLGKFAGNDTIKVPPSVYHRVIHEKSKGKHWTKYLADDDYGKIIREYANKNPKKPIIIEDENTGYLTYARYGGKSRNAK